jgi:hypothetical protein
MKKILKILATLVAMYIAFLVIGANFSAVPTKYKCTGNLTHRDETKRAEVFMLLKDYRWWVGLWSKSDGYVHIEAPNQLTTLLFEHVNESATSFDFQQSESDVTSYGGFSKLSNKLFFSNPYFGAFDGVCKEL